MNKFMLAVTTSSFLVGEQYPGVEVPKPTDMKIQGYDALVCSAAGKDKDGTECKFGFAWIFIDETNVAEVWYESATADEANQKGAGEILDSFKIADGK